MIGPAGVSSIDNLNLKTWDARLELTASIQSTIAAFYNRRRRHSSLGYIPPNEYQRRHQQPKAT